MPTEQECWNEFWEIFIRQCAERVDQRYGRGAFLEYLEHRQADGAADEVICRELLEKAVENWR